MHTKKCPLCAEEIQEEAIKCKHCKSDIPKNEVPILKCESKTETKIDVQKALAEQHKSAWSIVASFTKKRWQYLLGFAIVSVLLSALVGDLGILFRGFLSLFTILALAGCIFFPWRRKGIFFVAFLYFSTLAIWCNNVLPKSVHDREAKEEQAEEAKLETERKAREAKEASEAKATEAQREKDHADYLYPGDKCITIERESVADSLDNYKEARKVASIRDDDGMAELLTKGHVTILGKGIKTLVVENHFDFSSGLNLVLVRVLSGDAAGSKFWMRREAMKITERGPVYYSGSKP